MTGVQTLEKLRICGRLETYSTARHHLGYYYNVGLTATYTAPASISQSLEGSIYTALKQVISKHQILSAIALNEDKSHPDVYFARLPSIDLRTCVEFSRRKRPGPGDGESDEELEQLLTEQHDRSFKDSIGSKPFWRLAVLTSPSDDSTFTAAWIFHHALADGSSALLFHDSFLTALNSLGPSQSVDLVVKSLKAPLPPPFEETHPMPISWSFFLATIAKMVLPSIFDPRPAKLWTGKRIPSTIPTPPRIIFRTLVFSADMTQRLAQVSRREGVSVTATIECLVAASLFENLSAEQHDRIAVMGPISARRMLTGVQDDQMVNALTQWTFTHHRETADVFSWAEAHAVKSTILAAIAQSGQDNPIALLKYVSSIQGYLDSQRGKERTQSFELSNIGVYKPKEKTGQEWRIGRMTFSQCANPTGAAFGVNVVTGGDGNITVNFCWRADNVEEGLVEKVVDGVERGVATLLEGSQ
jgi:hypothetical protein